MQVIASERDENVTNKKHKCAYTECQIDSSHKHEVFQVLYLLISITILCNGAEQFTPFAVFLFCSPVFVDLLFFKATCRTNHVFKVLLLILSGWYTFMYVLCAGNIIIEHTDYFIVNKSNLLIGWLSEHPFSKQTVSKTLLPLILAPMLNWIGSADGDIVSISDVFRSFKFLKKR